jgi:hypothetical protein
METKIILHIFIIIPTMILCAYVFWKPFLDLIQELDESQKGYIAPKEYTIPCKIFITNNQYILINFVCNKGFFKFYRLCRKRYNLATSSTIHNY